MTNKLKEILSKIGVFFSTVWDNLIVEAFRRLVSAIRGMVMIDGDVYFTTKQKKDGSPRVFSLYFGLIGAIIIGIFFATLVFVAARAMTDYYINNLEWCKISERLHISERQLYRIHGNALSEFRKKFDMI